MYGYIDNLKKNQEKLNKRQLINLILNIIISYNIMMVLNNNMILQFKNIKHKTCIDTN